MSSLRQATIRPLAVDVGNTHARFALFQTGADGIPMPQSFYTDTLTNFSGLADWLRRHETDNMETGGLPSVFSWHVACVADSRMALLSDWLSVHRPGDWFQLMTWKDVPLEIALPEPEKVGIDRLLAAFAASRLFGSLASHLMVVDVGTAVTVDLVETSGIFHGGAILPGFRMAADALHDRTERLPRLPIQNPGVAYSSHCRYSTDYPGKDTVSAMRVGITAAICGAIRFCVDEAKRRHGLDRLPVVLTGASAEQLGEILENQMPEVFFRKELANLVLTGVALGVSSWPPSSPAQKESPEISSEP